MKITHISVRPLRALLCQPFRIATGQHDALENLLFSLRLSDGTMGYGEAAVATHITGETVPETARNLKTVGQYLCGQDVGDILNLANYTRSLLGQNNAASAAIEMALYDALTKHLKMPLWRLWGKAPKALATDITIVITSLEETRAKAKEFYAQGFRAFKVKIGRDMDEDYKRVLAVAGVVRRSSIILDANQGYSAEETLKFLKLLSKANVAIDLIEQPVPKQDWDGLKKVSRSTKVLVCADESVSSLAAAVRAVKEKAVGAINIKLMKTGIAQGVSIAQLAQANGIKLMLGGMMESNLAMTCSAHLASGLGCFDFIDLDTPFFIKNALKANPYLDSRGRYALSRTRPGIGIVP